MTSNGDRVRRSLEAMERGEIDAVAAEAHPEIEFVNPPYAIEPGTRNGVEGFKTGMRNMLDAFEELRFESLRVIDHGDHVIALGMWTGRGRGSRYRFEPQPFAFVVTLQDGQMIRYEWFAEHAEALRAGEVDPG
ncbi:MAG: nuclear transport factor 2 family protein [Solirubrobacterales bacterium]